ncbi:MAG: phnX [Actinomycetia bacterium]|nr:phnX [Actinomycetes bacterium]
MIRLAVLDMAGTTVRDDGVVEGAFVDALTGMGIEPGSAEMEAGLTHVRDTMGASKITVFRHLFDDEARATDANRRFEAAFSAAVARGDVEPLPGAEDALAEMRDAGVRICLTTGFSPETQQQLIAGLGWASRIDLALAPGPGVRGRPYPDLILQAVMRLEIDALAEVAVAGDTANDLLAGSRAGARIIAGVLTGAHDRRTLDAVPHTHMLETIAELPAVLRRNG